MMRRVWLVGVLVAIVAGCAAGRSDTPNRYQADAYLRAAAPTSYPSEYDIPDRSTPPARR